MKRPIQFFVFLLMAAAIVCSCEKIDLPEPEPEDPTHQEDPEPGQEEPGDTIPEDTIPTLGETIEVASYEVVPQNLVTGQEAVLVVHFDRPVRVSSLDINDGRCYADNREHSDDWVTWTIPMKFYQYGVTYRFKFSASELTSSKVIPVILTVPAYKDRYTYEGIANSVITDYDSETIWLTTRFPNRLYRISMADPEHPKYIDTDLSYNTLAINPYNGRLYAGTHITDDDDALVYDRKIHIYDATTLSETGSFVISHDGEGSDLLDVTPLSMAFTEDGYGCIVLSFYGSGGTYLAYVDSKDNHSLTYDYDWTPYYGSVHNHYDPKSLVLAHLGYCGPDIHFLSRTEPKFVTYDVANSFRSDEYYAGGTVDCIRLHRSQPLYLVQCVQSLCLIDYVRDTYSPVYISDSRADQHVEFDYNRDGHIIKYDGYNQLIFNIDMNTLEESFVGRILTTPCHISHNSRRDELITVQLTEDTGNTYLTTFDMNVLRGE